MINSLSKSTFIESQIIEVKCEMRWSEMALLDFFARLCLTVCPSVALSILINLFSVFQSPLSLDEERARALGTDDGATWGESIFR